MGIEPSITFELVFESGCIVFGKLDVSLVNVRDSQ
jgi:hypothetical protein